MDLIHVFTLLLREFRFEFGRLAAAEGFSDQREVLAERVDQNLLNEMQIGIVQLGAVDEIADQSLRLRPNILLLSPIRRAKPCETREAVDAPAAASFPTHPRDPPSQTASNRARCPFRSPLLRAPLRSRRAALPDRTTPLQTRGDATDKPDNNCGES